MPLGVLRPLRVARDLGALLTFLYTFQAMASRLYGTTDEVSKNTDFRK